jgi:hypothetical protein
MLSVHALRNQRPTPPERDDLDAGMMTVLTAGGDVQRRIGADRDIAAEQVVVDRGGDPDDPRLHW